jgi:predicted  nucleic acid-binding Zn-ribbon protein
MGITDIFKINELKAQLKQAESQRDSYASEFSRTRGDLESLTKVIAGTERMTAFEIQRTINGLTERKKAVDAEIESLKEKYSRMHVAFDQKARELDQQLRAVSQDRDRTIEELNHKIELKKQELVVLDDAILLQSYGFYEPQYDFPDSGGFKAKLDETRARQAELVKANAAVDFPSDMMLNNDKKEGDRMIKDYVKLVVRAFNNECDTSIAAVKFNNVASIEKKIRKALETLNKLTARLNIGITNRYLNLKLQELYLVHEYQLKKQDEKEEQKRIREIMREEAKLAKEIEEERLKIEKEEKHFNKALESVEQRLSVATTDVEREALERERIVIQRKLAETEKNKVDLDFREQNTRAGYVYIISNIGSFGQDIYKIGVTRRLEPEERVDELSNASVPFDFDIHAMIFSDDAPALETALHRAFDHRRLNLINRRREYFSVSLKEIERVVRQNFNKPVEFKLLAMAEQYRDSEARRKSSLENVRPGNILAD